MSDAHGYQADLFALLLTLGDIISLRSQPPEEPETKPHWRQHRESMKEKFPEGWNPPRRLSRGDMNTIRRLHTLDPIQFSTPNLAEQFKISAEAVRRILKSKFRTDEEVEEGKIGDALLEEAELGSYDKSRESPRRSSRQMQEQEPFKPQQWERKTTPAKPLQEGFDASKMSSNYKWAAGRKSQLRVVPHPSFVPRKWEDSRSIRELRETRRARRQGEREPRREEGSESRPVFQQRSW